ncbi:hypothetical protein Phum_PHUM359100 [Pediculus humanus corporis]|uniref:Uncharacterized protein n=1 Tax=Pediculus humanus subsp. corporis TaxID=121224 RepID=E0VPF5_PEDHC|nr:uncharacterized protein Phum_PHUM359100 [Pediculus humanus corporis]EEB15261.1 hypothetical protein Phum_PHUM359100 [Pediculus humanus corporis]
MELYLLSLSVVFFLELSLNFLLLFFLTGGNICIKQETRPYISHVPYGPYGPPHQYNYGCFTTTPQPTCFTRYSPNRDKTTTTTFDETVSRSAFFNISQSCFRTPPPSLCETQSNIAHHVTVKKEPLDQGYEHMQDIPIVQQHNVFVM